MADTEKGFNLSESCILGMTHCFSVVCISRHRCDRRYLRGMFRRSICGDQYSNQSNKDTAGNAKILIPKRGISENSSLTTKRSTAHSPHVVTTPKIRPMGTAVLHQFNASRRTNRIICCLLIPMQRIIPKKFGSLGQRYCSYCWKSSKRLQPKSTGTEQPRQKEGFVPLNCRVSLQ